MHKFHRRENAVHDHGTGKSPRQLGGLRPIGVAGAAWYRSTMNLFLLVIILFLLFGGGGFYFGGPAIGGGGLGLVLLICLVIYFMGGFRTKN